MLHIFRGSGVFAPQFFILVASAAARHLFPSVPTLLPAVHWDTRTDDVNNLIPRSVHNLYYSSLGVSDPSVQHAFAQIDTTIIKDAVVLEHSSYVKDVTCALNSIYVTFTNSTAFDMAKDAWSSAREFLLVTNVDGCGTRPIERSFWEVTAVAFQDPSLTIRATVDQELGSGVAMHTVNMTWGTWKPTQQPAEAQRRSARGKELDISLDNAMHRRSPHPRHRRRGFLGSIEDAISSAADRVGQVVSNGVTGALSDVGQFANAAANEALKLATTPINVFTPTYDTLLPLNIMPDPSEYDPNSPFTTQDVLLYQTNVQTSSGSGTAALSVWCVDCGVTGQLHLAGALNWDLDHGINTAYADFGGNIQVSVAIGIAAQAEYTTDASHHIIDLTAPPPGGFSVGDLVSIGPFFSLDARFQFDIQAQGTLATGATLSVADFKAHFDLLHPSQSSSSGFKPDLTPYFQSSAQVTATAALSIPAAIGLGVEIPPIEFQKSAELVEQPGITTTVSASTNGFCSGVTYAIGFFNNIDANAFDLTSVSIGSFSKTLSSGCYTPPSGQSDLKRTKLQPAHTLAAGEQGKEPKGNFTYVQTNDYNATDYAGFATYADDSEALNNGTTGAYPNGTFFVTIQDTTGSYDLVIDQLGDLRVANSGEALTDSYFAVLNGTVYGDGYGAFLEYFTDEMQQYNVSRIRLDRPALAPPTADAIFLVPAQTGNSSQPYLYAAIDVSSTPYALLTCSYAGQQTSAVFIALDGQQGLQTLRDPALRQNVTNGDVKDCYNVPWAVPSDALDPVWTGSS